MAAIRPRTAHPPPLGIDGSPPVYLPNRIASRDETQSSQRGGYCRLETTPVSLPAEERLFTDRQRRMLAADKHLRDAGLSVGQR